MVSVFKELTLCERGKWADTWEYDTKVALRDAVDGSLGATGAGKRGI